MAKLDRTLQKIFGEDGPSTEFGQIGSDNIGSPTTTKDLDTIQSLQAFADGLYTLTNNAIEPPRIQDFNSLHFLTTSQIKYIFQSGVPEWISTENYYANVSIVQVSGDIYLSLTGVDPTPNVGNDPTSSPSDWRKVLSSDGSLDPTLNLSDLTSASTARGNLDVYSTSEIDALVLDVSPQVVKTSDYTILSTDTNKIYVMNPNVSQYGNLTVTAPSSGASVLGKVFRVEKGTSKGVVKVNGNSGQNFQLDNKEVNELTLYEEGNFVEFYWNTHASKWNILNRNIIMRVNSIYNDDWTSVHLSNSYNYSSKNEAVDLTGHILTNGGNSMVCIRDFGGVSSSGTIFVYELSNPALGNLAISSVLTSGNGSTTITTTSGINSDKTGAPFYHGFSIPFPKYIVMYISDSGSLNSSYTRFYLHSGIDGSNKYGLNIHYISASSFFNFTTGVNGILRPDYPYNIINYVSTAGVYDIELIF
jgi:hypothetical protein